MARSNGAWACLGQTQEALDGATVPEYGTTLGEKLSMRGYQLEGVSLLVTPIRTLAPSCITYQSAVNVNDVLAIAAPCM